MHWIGLGLIVTWIVAWVVIILLIMAALAKFVFGF